MEVELPLVGSRFASKDANAVSVATDLSNPFARSIGDCGRLICPLGHLRMICQHPDSHLGVPVHHKGSHTEKQGDEIKGMTY